METKKDIIEDLIQSAFFSIVYYAHNVGHICGGGALGSADSKINTIRKYAKEEMWQARDTKGINTHHNHSGPGHAGCKQLNELILISQALEIPIKPHAEVTVEMMLAFYNKLYDVWTDTIPEGTQAEENW
jgi:hypothetical protein